MALVDGLRLGGRHVGHPQLDAVAAIDEERQPLAVGREARRAEAHARPAGRSCVSAPSAIFFSVMPTITAGACGPLVFGLTRVPASRSIGAARSAIFGMLTRSSSAITSRAGLTTADRRRRRVEDVDDDLGRQLIAGLELGRLGDGGRGGHESGDGQQREQDPLHGNLRDTARAARHPSRSGLVRCGAPLYPDYTRDSGFPPSPLGLRRGKRDSDRTTS